MLISRPRPAAALVLLACLAAACARSPRADTTPVPTASPGSVASGANAACADAGAAASGELALKHTPCPTTAAITAADLVTRLYIFADDSMLGRDAGTPGHDKAVEYIAAELRRMGLQPGGENGTYFQTIPLVARSFDVSSNLSVDGTPLVMWTDYAPGATRGLLRPLDGVQAVYGGVFGDTTRMLTAQQAQGKLVVFAPPASGAVLNTFRPTGPVARVLAAASGLAVASLDSIPPAALATMRANRSPVLEGARTSTPNAVNMLVTRRTAELLLGTSLDRAQIGAPGKTVRGELKFQVNPTPTRNVIAILPGADAALRGEYVAIGAHSDHVGVRRPPVDHDSLKVFLAARYAAQLAAAPQPGQSPLLVRNAQFDTAAARATLAQLRRSHPARLDSVANGADDDGSGSVALLEVAEAFARAPQRPKRSIIFVWHTGEEKGLLGSQYFTDHPTIPRDSIVAQLNMDMVGRGGPKDIQGGGPRYLQLVGSRRLSTELGDLVEAVNREQRAPFTFDYSWDANGHPERIYCRSDHYMYARYGIPITFFTTGLHADYHQLTDEPEYIDYPHMAAVAQLVHDIAVRVADLDHRVAVDKPKPENPAAPCVQ